MSKKNYYYCKKCNESWDEKHEKEYGACDSECPECESPHTPFDKKTDRDEALINNCNFINCPECKDSKNVRVFSKVSLCFKQSADKHFEIVNREDLSENIDWCLVTSKCMECDAKILLSYDQIKNFIRLVK